MFKKTLKYALTCLLVIVCIFSGGVTKVFADTATLSAGADASNTGTCLDNMAWTDPGLASDANDTTYIEYTGNGFDSGDDSDGLNFTNFGFSLGAGVTSIDGITVEVLAWTEAGGANYMDVVMLAGGARRGEDHASGSLPTSDPSSTYQSFGGSTDDWYAAGSWTQSEIEATDFGVTICFIASANNTSVFVDHVRITVDYTVAATPPSVDTDPETNVTSISATLNGDITATGGSNATVRGFAFGTNSGLTGAVSTTTESGDFGTGTFSQNISALLSGVTYYYRAYATNANGTGYGTIEELTTGTDSTLSRRLRLFEGFILKLFSSKIVIFQN